MAVVALIDDQDIVREAAASIINRMGHEVLGGESVEQALQLVSEHRPDVLMMDVHLPDGDADHAVAHLRNISPDMPIILFSGDLELETSTRAIQSGVFEYLTKPFTYESVALAIREALARRKRPGSPPTNGNGSVPRTQSVRVHTASRRLLGESSEICRVNLLIERFAKTRNTPVLVVGESGTGKELAASAIHHLSQRSSGPFIKINCAAIPRSLMEAELFGHEKGSFTDAKASRPGVFEMANNGTLFLDEIGELDLDLQPKLLRVLEDKLVTRIGGRATKEVDVRIIAATNRHLPVLCNEGRFREDLYFRLAVLQIDLPPLRHRGSDVHLLANHFLQEKSQEMGRYFTSFSPEITDFFSTYHWPGNVRELRNIIERLIILSPSHGVVRMSDSEMRRSLCVPLRGPGDAATGSSYPGTPQNFDKGSPNWRPAQTAPSATDSTWSGQGESAPSATQLETPPVGTLPEGQEVLPLEDVEKNYILCVLRRMDNNRSRAAVALGIARSTLNRKLARYGLEGDSENDTMT